MFFDTIAAINKVVNDFVWGVPAMACIIGVGLLLSVRTGFLQIRKFPFALKTTIGRMFHKKEAAEEAGVGPREQHRFLADLGRAGQRLRVRAAAARAPDDRKGNKPSRASR